MLTLIGILGSSGVNDVADMVNVKCEALALIAVFLASNLSLTTIHQLSCVEALTENCFSYTSKMILTNRGNCSWTPSEYDRTYSIFMNNSWQTVCLMSCNWPYRRTQDLEGNPIIVLDTPVIPPNGSLTMAINLRIIERERKAPVISFNVSGTLDDIPSTLKEEYCRSQGTWLFDEALRNLSYWIWNSENFTVNVLRIVRGLADWIGENTEYASFETPLYPNETYSLRKGDCDDQSNLLVTLCRILGIPAFLQVGCLQNLEFPENETYWSGHFITYLKLIGFHAWAMIFIPPWGWLPFDMTLGWSQSDALRGIKSAAIYSKFTALMINVTESDWAGDARTMKERIVGNQIYLFDEEELVLQSPWTSEERFWQELAFWLITSVSAFGLVFIIVKRWFRRKREVFNEPRGPPFPR